MKAGIAGAGIMGQLLALALVKNGWEVTLFDHNLGPYDNCSYAAAGLLAPFSELEKSEAIIAHLGQEGLKQHWPSLLHTLDQPIYFNQAGSLVVHHPQDESEWVHFSQKIESKAQHTHQILNQKELLDLEPELTKFEKAYFFREEGQIDCQAVLTALQEYLQNQSTVWHQETKVTQVQPRVIHAEDDFYAFDMVFDCRGLGAKPLFANIRGLRGELIWVHAPEVNLQRPVRLLHPRYSLYIAPRPNHIYLIGASEIEAEDYGPISVRSTLEFLTAAYYIHPGFAEARIIKNSTQCRPCLPHHLPSILSCPGLIAVNGLYRHGYLIAPALVAEILRGLNGASLHYSTLWGALV